jgi:type I restriction enzyme S subunit
MKGSYGLVLLGEVCEFVRGITFKPTDKVGSGTLGAIPCFRTKNIQNKLDLRDLIFIPRRFARRTEQMLQAGDTLISTANSKEMVGKCSFISKLPFEATLGGFITAVRPHKHLVNPGYLYNWLNSPDVRITLRQTARQTTNIANLPLSQVAKLKIPLPPIPEQMRIVTILDAAEELRSLREKADQRTSYLIPALFHEMFGDPATNPKGWPIVRVRDVMTSCEYGTSTKGNEEGKGVPVLRMGNITTEGNLDLSDLKHVELSEAEREKYRLQEGDILFNRTNSRVLVGKTGMWDGRFAAVAASYFIRLRFNDEKEHPQHFTTFMNLPKMKRELAGIARGAVGQANINGKELQNIRFPLPPISLQRKFADRVAEIRATEAQQAESCRRLDNLFQSLLHRAFRGDL